MYQFNKIPSLIQILAADWVAVLFLFPVVSNLYERLNPSVGYRSLPLDTADYVFFAIGLLVFAWLLATIFRPAVHATTFIPVFHAGGASIPNPQMRADYLFSSTHPSYVLVDLLSCSLWWFARWAWSEGWQERVYQGTILLVMGMAIPALRLVAWYGLRPRPKGEDVQDEVRNSWKPVALLYGVLLGIALITAAVIIPTERRNQRENAQKEANLTVVDSDNWQGGETFEALRDRSKEGVAATRVIRLRATQKSPAAMSCGNSPDRTDFATVLATMGGNDDILIFSYSGWSDLVNRASGNEGKPIEAMGRLMQMRDKHPAWKKYCGLEELSPRPRWLFEEEGP